jgi:hypothetical protein
MKSFLKRQKRQVKTNNDFHVTSIISEIKKQS